MSIWLARGPQFLRYAAGSAVMLGLKLLLMQEAVGWLREVPAYAAVQVAVFFASYAWHSRVTFAARFSRGGLGRYLRTMVGFQALDWLLFSVIFTRLGVESNLAILTSTAVVFVVRFVCVRRSLLPGGGA
ncbi:MAG: hypothetical protein R3D98_05960 [Candidatus Krumholzibacteriia bacterium]